ncbi:MAG: hypothetical protein ACRC0F_09210 [Cetobacterium sp.]
MGFRNRYIIITEINKGEVLNTLESLRCWKFSTKNGIVKPTEIDEEYFVQNVVCSINHNKRLLFFSTDVLTGYEDGGYFRYVEISPLELKSYLK